MEIIGFHFGVPLLVMLSLTALACRPGSVQAGSHETHIVRHSQTTDPQKDGFWTTKNSWKSRWVKYWQTRTVYVPVWKKVWTPVVQNEWVPLPNTPGDDKGGSSGWTNTPKSFQEVHY